MNARPINLRLIWMVLLSALVIYVGAIGGGDSFGLTQVQAEQVVDFDVFDDDEASDAFITPVQRPFAAVRLVSSRLRIQKNLTMRALRVLKPNPPTGPPLRIHISFA